MILTMVFSVSGFKDWVDGWAEGKTKGFIRFYRLYKT
jgi:hypothetical protein